MEAVIIFKKMRWYGGLAQLATLGAYRRHMKAILKQMPNRGRLLVAGGGTGWFAWQAARQCPNLLVVYYDPSPAMVQLTRQRATPLPHNLLVYQQAKPPIKHAPYEAVAVNFVFDIFTPTQAIAFIKTIKNNMAAGAKLFVVDYKPARFGWQKIFFKLMFIFFENKLPNLQNKKIYDYIPLLTKQGFKTIKQTNGNLISHSHHILN